jgi:hypothetical protein
VKFLAVHLDALRRIKRPGAGSVKYSLETIEQARRNAAPPPWLNDVNSNTRPHKWRCMRRARAAAAAPITRPPSSSTATRTASVSRSVGKSMRTAVASSAVAERIEKSFERMFDVSDMMPRCCHVLGCEH